MYDVCIFSARLPCADPIGVCFACSPEDRIFWTEPAYLSGRAEEHSTDRGANMGIHISRCVNIQYMCIQYTVLCPYIMIYIYYIIYICV